MKLRYQGHSLIFALVPAVALLSHNIDMAPPVHAVRPIVLTLLLCTLLLVLFSRLYRDPRRGASLTSIALLLFFSYGHVYSGLVTQATLAIFQRAGLVGRHEILAPVWTALFILAAFAVSRLKTHLATLTAALTVMGVAALVVPLAQIASYEIRLSIPWGEAPPPIRTDAASVLPDIYYIVLDGYAGDEVLRSVYGYDNTAFLGELARQGFLIADRSRSNYMQTSLSLASSLNLEYLDDIQPSLPTSGDDRAPLARLIRWSAARRILEASGYCIVGLPTGYRVTELENADRYLAQPLGAATTLERLAFETSGLILLRDIVAAAGGPTINLGYAAHRQRLLFTLDQLRQAPALPGPKFVFVHVVLPHPPFVFDSQGQPLASDAPFTLMDGDAYLGDRDSYLIGYRNQLTYLNGVLPVLLQDLIDGSSVTPVILLQADHGPGSGLSWNSYDDTDLDERTSILNAYLIPAAGAAEFTPSISPVNSFRLVFNAVFDAGFPLLQDASYFSTWNQPYDFRPIPDSDGSLGPRPALQGIGS